MSSKIKLSYELLSEKKVMVKFLKDLNMGNYSDVLSYREKRIIQKHPLENISIEKNGDLIIENGLRGNLKVSDHNINVYELSFMVGPFDMELDLYIEDEDLNEYCRGVKIYRGGGS